MQREILLKCSPTRLLAQEVTPSPSARNLGIIFDSALNFKSHISGISRACYYHIRDMRKIRRFLTPYFAKSIATSLIGSKLDYCNSVLFDVTEKEISKLQGVQNCLARVVTKPPRFCHINIRNMLQPSRKVRTLRSSDLDQLNVPRVRTAVGSRAFSVAAPRL